MDDNIDFLERKYFELTNRSLGEKRVQFAQLADCLASLNKSLSSNTKSHKPHPYFTAIYSQYITDNQKLIEISNSIDLLTKPVKEKSVDALLAYQITKIQLEAFSLLHFLFIEEVSSEERDFRLKQYRLWTKEKSNSLFSIEESISKSSIPTEDFLEKWSIYTEHIESERVSTKQTSYLKEKRALLKESLLLLSINSSLTAKLCVYLVDRFPYAKRKYDEIKLRTGIQIEQWYI